MTVAPAEAKSCCAAVYASDQVRYLLGDSLHPGGARLTMHLLRALRVGPRATVVDVGSGLGSSAVLLARHAGCRVVGFDISAGAVREATLAAQRAGLEGQIRFIEADAEALPLDDHSVDGVLSECALCLFPDKVRATREIARVLRPGARVALSDVTATGLGLPQALHGIAAHVACLADARPLDEIAGLLESAGLQVEATERHDAALGEILDRAEARLRAARVLRLGAIADHIETAEQLLAAARSALTERLIGYGVVIARA